MTLLSTECQNLRELDRERAIILAISRLLMGGQWLEVLRVTRHKTRKIMSKMGSENVLVMLCKVMLSKSTNMS